VSPPLLRRLVLPSWGVGFTMMFVTLSAPNAAASATGAADVVGASQLQPPRPSSPRDKQTLKEAQLAVVAVAVIAATTAATADIDCEAPAATAGEVSAAGVGGADSCSRDGSAPTRAKPVPSEEVELARATLPPLLWK